MRVVSSVVPTLTILAAGLLAALPWGFGSEYRFFLPHAVYLVVHFWTLRSPDRVPEWIVFGAGLTLDVLTSGPLGYWSLVFLIGYVIAVLQSPWAASGKAARWLLFAAALTVLALVEWGLATLYFLEWADWHPFARATLGIGLAYPLFALVLHVFDAPRDAGPSLSSGRRG